MDIVSNKVIVFINDQPVVACEGATFTIDNQDLPVLAPPVEEWVIECHGFKYPELTRKQALELEWIRSARLPRKKKKAYRKKINYAMITEWHREHIHKFLSTLGPPCK